MTNQTFIFRCVIVAATVIACLLITYNFIIKPFMTRMKYNQRIPIVEVFGTIDIIVSNECTLYERYLTNTTDMSFIAMTNSQFINVYNDIGSRVLHALSPGFLELANVYLTTDEINTYTARMVYNWLADKIQTVPDSAQDMDDEDTDDQDTVSKPFLI